MLSNQEKEKATTAAGGTSSISLGLARSRRPASEKIALGAAIIGGIASLGGNITLLLVVGSPSISSLIILICWLTSVLILALRSGWGLLLSSLLGGVILFEFSTTPYVIEHLSNPNSPDGGLGVFIGDLLVIGCGIALIGGSLRAAWQHYRAN
jgi:hypothetical protein